MALPRPPDNTIRMSLSGTWGDCEWANIFWLSCTTSSTPVQADLDSIVDGVEAAFQNRFKALQMPTRIITAGKATMYLPSTAELVSVRSYSDAGTLGGGVAAPGVSAAVISWTINAYYRGGHPRTYICGLSVTQIANENELGTGVASSFASAAGSFLSDVNALTSTNVTAVSLGTLSRYRAGAVLATPVFYPYVGHRVNNRLGNQRRRQGKLLTYVT